LTLIGLLDLQHREHPASIGTLNERRQELLLLLGAQVLVTPPSRLFIHVSLNCVDSHHI
jgi:hypothetical protein